MVRYSKEDKENISNLVAKYRSARGYSYDELATAVGLGGGAHLQRLENPTKRWPGLRVETAINLDLVLRFGDVDSDSNTALGEEDHEAWFAATHLEELHRHIEGIRVDRRVQSLLRNNLGNSSPAYIQKWVRARGYEWQLRYREAVPLLEKAIGEANNSEASDALLGIMHHDLAEGYLALGNLKKAKTECERSERLYQGILKSGLIKDPNVQLGLARAKIQKLQMNIMGGEEESERNTLLADVRQNLQERDHYGWAKTFVLLGYLHAMEEEFDLALSEAKEAYDHARQIDSTSKSYWSLRDGLAPEGGWMEIHAVVLQGLVADLAFAMHGERIEIPRIQGAKPWWAKDLPPTSPFYSWKSKSGNPRDMERMVKELEQLHVVQYLPLTMIAYGDYLAGEQKSYEHALACHQQAKEVAVRHGLKTQARLADRRMRR